MSAKEKRQQSRRLEKEADAILRQNGFGKDGRRIPRAKRQKKGK